MSLNDIMNAIQKSIEMFQNYFFWIQMCGFNTFEINISYKNYHNYYNKLGPCTPSDFTGFWVNSLALVNKTLWGCNEFIGLVNGH